MRIRVLGGVALLSAALMCASGLTAAAAVDQVAADLGLGSQERLTVRNVVTDQDGTRHVRYDRSYGGLPVLGGDLIVQQSRAGAIQAVRKASTAKLDLDVQPAISAPQAAEAAATGNRSAKWSKAAPTLIVYALAEKPVLAWETVLTGIADDQTPSVLHVVTDAKSGQVLLRYDEVEQADGTGNAQYVGQVALNTTQVSGGYQFKDGTRGGQAVNDLKRGTSGSGTLFTDADNIWGDGTPANNQTAAVDAGYGAAQTWDYYKNVHGRNGIRNDGVGALSRVHYGNNYSNAFWQDSCFCMTYGDGSGNAKPLTSLDVAAHEMTHGVTSATAKLVYSGESGGLNEATSDIFAATVEFNANNPADPGDYLVGEKVDIYGTGKPLRYMDNPSKDGRSADYWSPNLATLDVHYSSGVANHFFYILSEGSGPKTVNGVAYDSPTYDGKLVAGIGRAKAEQIWYRALTTKFTSATNYAAARVATLAATTELYGYGGTEYGAVTAAWNAVNVR